MVTKYRYLSTEELVRLVEGKYPTSPIILELLARLNSCEGLGETPIERLIANSRMNSPCPECEADLEHTLSWDVEYLYFGLRKAD